MAVPSSESQSCYHTRSNSFPSRPHPLIPQLDEHLCRLRTTSDASSSIDNKLSGLQDLHDCAHNQLPLIQQTMAQQQCEKWVDELLEGSLQVLDLCTSAKDALFQTKECLQKLQSILRTRRWGEISVSSESKCTFSTSNENQENRTVLTMLKEVEAATCSVLESLLSIVAGPKAKTAGWSLVSKLLHHKKVACLEEEAEVNAFAKADDALLALVHDKTGKSDKFVQIKDVQSHLQNLELCIQDFEEGLETLLTFHARSNSLPSRPHPLMSELDQHICRLKDSQATSTSSSSLGHNLSALQDLHDCVNKVLLLPLTQQAFVQERHQRWIDELLDGSLRLLDVCNTAKDALLHTKECIHELQSVIRRRQGSAETAMKKYLSSRKVARKAIKKSLKHFRTMENKHCSFSNEDHEIVSTISMLKEVEAITVSVFESMSSFIEPKSRGWSLVSKLMVRNRVVACEQNMPSNEFATADAALESLLGCKTSKSSDNTITPVETVQKQLNGLDLCIQDLEDGIECLFRRMIKTRALFLNIFN
ncbi:hypothetical protein Tsubulata_025359, partial [Turnera subulata]